MTNINFLSNLVVKNEVNHVLAAEKKEVNCAPADAKRLQIAGGGASRHEALIVAEQFSQSCALRSEGAQHRVLRFEGARYNVLQSEGTQKERSGRTMYKAQKENTHRAELFGYHGAFIPDGHPTADRQSCMTPVGDQRRVKRQNDHELPLTYPLFAPYLPLTYTSFDTRSSVFRQSDVATRVWKYAACVVMLLAMSVGQAWGQSFTFENSNSTTSVTTNNITYTCDGSGTSTTRFGSSLKFMNLGSGKKIQFVSTTSNISRIEIKACSNNSAAKKCMTIKTSADASSYSVPSTFTATLDGSSATSVEDMSLTGTGASDWQTLVINFNANATLPRAFQILRGSNNLSVYSVKVYTAPTALATSDVTSEGVTFTVTDGANTNNYDIYYSTSTSVPNSGTSASTTISSAKTKSITGLESGQTYYAWVRSTWSSGTIKGDWRPSTASVSFTTEAGGGGGCSAPSSVAISGEWRYFPGQTIDLTATPTGHTGTPQYQWQKEISTNNWQNVSNGTEAGVTISGATTNNLKITPCGTGNTGKYRCSVSTGATCSCTSDSYDVKIFSLNGAYDDGEFSSNDITFTSGTAGTATVHLAAGRVYKFKVTDNFGMWFGNSGKILEPASNWTFPSNNNDNCVLFTGPEGDYTFTVDIDHVTYGTPEVVVSVAYPDVTHPSAGYAYFKNVDNWTNVGLYMWYEGGGSYTSWDSEPWVTRTTTICGNTYYYTPLIPSWYNRVIFREVGGSGKTGDITIANLTAYSGKYNDKSDANWHDFTTYGISFNAGGGMGTMSAIEGICPSADQALPANTFGKTGYTFAGWKDGNGTDYANEATISGITSNITLTAQWTPKEYTITLGKGSPSAGDGVADGSAKVLYNGTALTNISHATYTGHNLTGYYDSNSGGTKIFNADGSFAGTTIKDLIADGKWVKDANTSVKAQWTAKTTTITINANTANHGSTTPGTVTATYGSALPLFTTAVGVSGYSLTGYFTEATSGTKIINADGTLVPSTDYADGSGKWKSEAATLTLFAQYEEEADEGECIEWAGTPSSWTDGKMTINSKLVLEADPSDASKTAISTGQKVWGDSHTETVIAISGTDNYIQGYFNDGSEISTITISAANNNGNASTDKNYLVLFCANSSFSTGVTGQLHAAPSYKDAKNDSKLVHEFTAPAGTKYFRIYRKINSNVGDYSTSNGAGDGQTTRIYHIEVCSGDTPEPAGDEHVYYYKDATHYVSSSYKNPEGGTPSGTDNVALTTPWTIRNSTFMTGLTSVVATAARYDNKGNHMNAYIKLRKDDNAKIAFTIASGYTATIKIKMGGYSGANTNITMKLNDSGDNITYSGTMSGAGTTEDNYAQLTYADLAAGAYTLKPTSGSLYISQIDIETEAVAACTAAPTVTAGSNSCVTSTTATVSCASGISSLGTGGCTITEYGFVIGESANPEIGGSGVTKHVVGTTYTTTGTSFSKDLTGLTASTTYYVRPYATNGFGTAYGTETSFTTTAAATLYTVTFESNGGSSVSPITQGSEGASVALANPTRAGFEFDGWYKTDGTKVSSPSYTPTADITLYARWQETCDAEGVAKSTTDVVATGYTAYQEKGGSNVVFTSAPSLGFKYKDAKGTLINNPSSAATRNNAYKCQISSDSGNKGSIKTNSTFSNVDSISFYFAASDKGGCKIAVWCSTDNFSTDSTSLLSATTYGDSNNEFKLKTLAIPSGKKASALTFKFRFTVTSSGKTSYIDSLKVYSSTSGGGTCYHVYYHGNGAESGYVNDTVSYTAGSKATVLNYNYGRNPLAKAGNDFQGWATSADGAVAYTAGQKIDITSADVDLYAVWATASTALVNWTMKINTSDWTTTATSTTDVTNISSIGTARTTGSDGTRSEATAKVTMATAEVSGSAAPSNSANFTFTIAGGKQVEINKFDCKVFNVSDGNRTYKAQISDAAGNVYNSTNTVPVTASATLTDASFVFGSGKILRGAVTIRIYAWKTSGSPTEFRMGPDVKFYGTVEDYVCATPAAPTISGVSEYVPGQTITLTASHDGENYDNLTTYTWYKGDTWDSKSQVQAAATGESGYTLTIADCTTGNAGLYWCEAANGTCKAHNAAGYDVTVFPAYTITYNLNGGTLDGTEKTSYTQFDEDYTLPTPTKTGSVFAGWYGASDFSGLPTVVLGAGSVGNKEYWAKWGETVTVSWTVTKVDDELYRGGGGYSVKAVINENDWSIGFMDELELTATEGVTLKNIEVSENGESKVQVTADFDITTGLAADATEITFTLNVPADGKYGPKVDEHEEDLTSCAGSSTTITIFDGATMNDKTDADDISYKSGTEYTDGTTGFKYKCAGFKKDLVDVTEYTYHGSYSNAMKYGGNSTSYYISMTIPTGYTGSMEIVYGSTDKTKYFAFGTSNSSTANGSNGTKWNATTAAATTLYSATIDDLAAGTYYLLATGDKAIVAKIAMTLYATGGGITPTLTWDDGDADIANDGVSKSTSNDDFVYTARQDKNSLGAITYSSSDATVATVNSTTGQVHLVGAAGSATITATIAASGCYESASVSYTITVTDDCDDEAGTIATEDLGCPGIKMTVTGHTAAAGVSYQWYKVGTPSDATVGTNQDNFTATEAGSYYVIVTNTGDRHCAKRSTNTVTVEAKAAATATKIVDSWYVKNGRRTPDIALVKTTNATGFTVKRGSTVIWNSDNSVTTGFGGCAFELKDDDIIYLHGTQDGGAATTGLTAGDETLTITAIGCGNRVSQTITIHCQAATNYKEIAFVADGGKGMKKDSITVGHGDGTELYEYLDSVGTAAKNRLFKLSERNIYWTTDEKAIREEYSQFDAILITDDPSTNTVVKTGDDYKTKGYVNAFGTMVDVRPIFTMEAYVSALKNWGSKGIAGNPQSPNPRQYEMRLECKDHEIYGAGLPDPSDGTNVWEEVIDGETFRHVILVDSTKGVYKGVAYNAETAGNEKPALQGFTGEAAGSLLGLGRILEGTLQAAIERQEEPAARLLVMGINAKALQPTCALTNEGKTVIKNILVYLLKTNMEEVDDCSNYFTGKNSTSWSDPGNWSKKSLPSTEAKVRILAPCVISGIQPHVLQVSIVNSGNSNIRNTATGSAVCDGTLTIQPDGALIADGKIRSAVAPHFAANDLMPTTPEMLTINTRSDAQAALIFNNEEGLTKATVNLYSLGRTVSEANQFQYMAVPMEYVAVNPTFANEHNDGKQIYTYVWHENGGWERRGYYADLQAFEGVGITTSDTEPRTYTMKGNLASTAEREIALTHDSKPTYGNNIIGNSWMAPIDIASLKNAIGNDDAVMKTIYIYCTGQDPTHATSNSSETAGQWLAIPIDAAGWSGWSGIKVIPAMQAFLIRVSSATTLTLNYNEAVRTTAAANLNEPLRAPRRKKEGEETVTLTRLCVEDSKTHTDLYLFEGERFSDEYDNGWEANFMPGDGRSAQFYARGVNGKMAVLATNELEGTKVGFEPGQEREYTIRVMGSGISYYLNDLKEKKSMLISEGNTYSFTYEEGDEANRFLISGTPFEAPQTPTDAGQVPSDQVQGTKVQKVIYQDKVYIIRGGKIYDIVGKVVK